MRRLPLFVLILPFFSLVSVQIEEAEGCDSSPIYRASLRHIESGGIGYNEGYTTLDTFFAVDPSLWKVTPFINLRGHVFNDGKWAANAGVGLRALCGNRIWGINTYYDYRNAKRLDANQLGVGLESLGEDFDFRLNGYLPVGRKNSHPYKSTFGSFSGNNLLVSQKYQSAMKGADAEIGYHVVNCKFFDLYVAAGPYYYVGEIARSTWGGKARVVGSINDYLSIEISDSYDRAFRNNFQGQISFNFAFGPQSKTNGQGCNSWNRRMLQPVERQEIIVINSGRKKSVATDPLTGDPYFFVFVDNTSSSDGTFESPYHTLAQAQDNSSDNNIIYVFPGDGTTTGMDSGISLKANQKFWGSGISHSLLTSQGEILIPNFSSTAPTITNTNIDTEGNAITLATNNAISGFTISSALNDAIYGLDPQTLDVSSCTFQNTNTYAIEAMFSGDASVSLQNNQFLNNVNGVYFNFNNGTSSFNCSNNTFKDQTSVSSTPIEIASSSNILTTNIENNIFDNNTTGGIRFGLYNVLDADIKVLNNTVTNSGTGSQSSLGSSLTVISNGTVGNCSLLLQENEFTGNDSNALYLHTSGSFTNLDVTASSNTLSNNGGSGLVLATPVDNLRLVATDNTITNCNDNGIAVIASGSTTTGHITISNNVITDIGNASNGIAINQDFSALDLTLSNNEINRCEGTGIISYAPTGIDSLNLNVSDNTISNCQNLSSNAAAGLDIEQFSALQGSITNNTLEDNSGLSVFIGSTLPTPTACLTLSGNTSTDYFLSNPVDGVFNLSPCDADTANTGTINTSGTITPVQSCPEAEPCPP